VPPRLTNPLTEELDLPWAQRRRAGLAYSILCKMTGYRPPTPPPRSERDRALQEALDEDVDDDHRAVARRRAMAAAGGVDEAALLRARAEGISGSPLDLALADPTKGPRVTRDELPGLIQAAGVDLVPGQTRALLVACAKGLPHEKEDKGRKAKAAAKAAGRRGRRGKLGDASRIGGRSTGHGSVTTPVVAFVLAAARAVAAEHPRWLVRPVPGDAFQLASADGTRLDIGEFLLAVAVAGVYVVKDPFRWAAVEDAQFAAAREQEELAVRARRATQLVQELELAGELAKVTSSGRGGKAAAAKAAAASARAEESAQRDASRGGLFAAVARARRAVAGRGGEAKGKEAEDEDDPIADAKEAAAAAATAAQSLERPADLLAEEASRIAEMATKSGAEAVWARLARIAPRRAARAVARRFRERHGIPAEAAAFVCGEAAYELFRPGGAAPGLYQRARSVFFRHSSDGDFLYPTDFHKALADLTLPSLEAEDRAMQYATEVVGNALHAVALDAWTRRRAADAAEVMGVATGLSEVEAGSIVSARGPGAAGAVSVVSGARSPGTGAAGSDAASVRASGSRKQRSKVRRAAGPAADVPLTLDVALAHMSAQCVPDAIRALLIGSPGQRSGALARLMAAEEQRRMLDLFGVVDKVQPPVVARTEEGKISAARVRKERRKLRLDFYKDEKDRREQAEAERERRRKALEDEAALRRKVEHARLARERAEEAAERSAMQKLEEAAQAEVSRRGADFLDFSGELLEREPDAAAIARACAKTAKRAEMTAVTLADCARMNLSNNYIRVLASSFLFQVLQVRILDLSNNRLQAVPDALCGMGSLEVLKLAGNALEGLPERMGRMARLRLLDVRGNCLTALPPEVLLLRELEVILLAGNPSLTALPEPPEGSREERVRKAAEAASAAAKGNVGTTGGPVGARAGSNAMSHEAVLEQTRLAKKRSAIAKDLDSTDAQRNSFAPRIWPKVVFIDLTGCGLDRLPYDCWWLRLPCLSELRLDGNPLTTFSLDFGPVEGTVEWMKKDETRRRRRAMDRALGLRDKAIATGQTARAARRAGLASAASSAGGGATGEDKDEDEDDEDEDEDDSGTADAEAAAARAALQVPPWRVPRLRLSVSNLLAGGTTAGFEGLSSVTLEGMDVIDALSGARQPRPDGTAANLVRATADEFETTVVGGVRVLRRRDPRLFEVLSTTHTVLMRDAGLRSLPRSLAPWEPHLRYLDVSHNLLAAIPHPSAGRLRSLRALNVSHNRLDAIPASLCALSQLRHLDISHNPAIVSLPDEFGAIKNLRTLICRGNTALRKLPSTMKLQTRLRRIDFAGCRSLGTIRVRMQRLTSLTALRCCGCSSMTEFPGSGGAVTKEGKPGGGEGGASGGGGGGDKPTKAPSPPPNLRLLDLSESGVGAIDVRALKAMPRLRVLEIRHTGLRHLPSALARHRGLRVVDVRNNFITQIPPEFVRWFVKDPRDAARERAQAAARAEADGVPVPAAAGEPPRPPGGVGARLVVEEAARDDAEAKDAKAAPLDLTELSDAELERITEAAAQAESILGSVSPLVTLLARRAMKERAVDPRRMVTLPPLRARLRVSGNPLSEMASLKGIGRGLDMLESLAGRGPAARRRMMRERWRAADLVDRARLEAAGDVGDDDALPDGTLLRGGGGTDARALGDHVDQHMSRSRQRRASLAPEGDLTGFRDRRRADWEEDPGRALRRVMNRALHAARTVPSTIQADVVSAPPEVHGTPEQAGTMVFALQEHEAEALHGGERWRALGGAKPLFDEDSEDEDERAAATGPGPGSSSGAARPVTAMARGGITEADDSGDEEAWACGVFDFGGTASQGFDTAGAGTGTHAANVSDVARRGAAGLARAVAERRAFGGKVGGRAAAVKALAGAYGGPLASQSASPVELYDPGAEAEDALDMRVVHAMLLEDCLSRAIRAAWAATRTPVPTEFLGAVKAEMSGPGAAGKYALPFHDMTMRPGVLRAHARLRKASGIAPLSGSELRARFMARAKDLLGEALAASIVDSTGGGAASMELSKTAGWVGRTPATVDHIPSLERSLRYIRNTTIDSSVIFRFNRLLEPPPEPDVVEYVVQRPETEAERRERASRERDAGYADVGELDVFGDGVRAYRGINHDRPREGKAVRFFRHMRRDHTDPDPRPAGRRPARGKGGAFELPVGPALGDGGPAGVFDAPSVDTRRAGGDDAEPSPSRRAPAPPRRHGGGRTPTAPSKSAAPASATAAAGAEDAFGLPALV